MTQGSGFADAAQDRNGWLALGTIAAGTFLLVTTEFLPIGLLSRIAQELHVSEGTAGLAVTAPGLMAAIAAPALMLLAGKTDRRTIIVALTALIVLSNTVAAIAQGFAVFLTGRLILGLAVGGLWSFAVATGRRLVSESDGARATSIISAGIGLGTVCGMPVGAVIGEWAGWRTAFALNAVLGVAVVLSQLWLLPRLPALIVLDLRRLSAFLAVPMARVGLLASGCVAGGHFIAYTFLEPYLRDQANFGQDMVAMSLAAYAVFGIAGAFLGERLALKGIHAAFVVAAGALGLAILAAAFVSGHPVAVLLMVAIWGTVFGAVPVCVQIWMFTSSPRLYEAGSALMVSAFQIALGLGAALGGVIADSHGFAATFAVGGLVVMVGGVLAWMGRYATADGR